MHRALAFVSLAACAAEPTSKDASGSPSTPATPEAPGTSTGCRGCGSTSTTYTWTLPTEDVDYEVVVSFQLVPDDGLDPGRVQADFVGVVVAADDASRVLVDLVLPLEFSGTNLTLPSPALAVTGPVGFRVDGLLDVDADGAASPGDWAPDPEITFQAIEGRASVIVPLVPID